MKKFIKLANLEGFVAFSAPIPKISLPEFRATPPGWGGLVGAPQNDPRGVFGGLHLELLVGLKISGGSRWGDYDTFGGIFNNHLSQIQSKYRRYAPDFIFMMYIVLFLV